MVVLQLKSLSHSINVIQLLKLVKKVVKDPFSLTYDVWNYRRPRHVSDEA